MTTTSRPLLHSWNTAWTTAPPPACATLRNLRNTVAWGQTCVFAAEDGDPLPFPINTACLPWITSQRAPPPSAFYSPATGCPASWTAVATPTTGPQWLDGESAVLCCPAALEGDGGAGCRPRGSGAFAVTECGEADAEENELRTYRGDAWPPAATLSVDALQLRWQASDTGGKASASASLSTTGGSGGASDASGNGTAGGSTAGGLSTGATAAIATVIPLVVLVGALAAFLLWRRNKKLQAIALGGADPPDEEEKSARDSAVGAVPHQTYQATPAAKSTLLYETPEWNAELDGTEAERQRLVSPSLSPSVVPVSAAADASATSELGGLARMQRKRIAPVEIDSREIVAEVGDAYIPYRPGR